MNNDKNLDVALMPSFISTFTNATDQAGKLGLGKNKSIISMHSNYQVKALISFIQNNECIKFLF